MASIKVDSSSMREKAETFNTVATNISGLYDDMNSEIQNMKSVWEGEAEEAAVSTFESYRAKFEEITTAIQNYSKFLEEAAQAYDSTETANTAE